LDFGAHKRPSNAKITIHNLAEYCVGKGQLLRSNSFFIVFEIISMEQGKIIQEMKKANDVEICKNELYGQVYTKMISLMAKNSAD